MEKSCIFCKFSYISIDDYGYSFYGCQIAKKKINEINEIFPEEILCKNCDSYCPSLRNLTLLYDLIGLGESLLCLC